MMPGSGQRSKSEKQGQPSTKNDQAASSWYYYEKLRKEKLQAEIKRIHLVQAEAEKVAQKERQEAEEAERLLEEAR